MQELVKSEYLKTIENEFGIKQIKKVMFSLSSKVYVAPSEVYTPSDVSMIIKEASLSAVTSPHLLAIFVLMETNRKKELMIIESEENEMSKEEKIGVLLNANKKMFGTKEVGITHQIDSTNIASYLFSYAKDNDIQNIHIVNVHHDYIRSFYQHPISTSNFIWNIMENGSFNHKRVIRKTTEKGG